MEPMTARTRRPLVGLTGRRTTIGDVAGMPAALGYLTADLYFGGYAQAVYAAGGLPVHLPLDVEPHEWAGQLDALLLTGGADVDPGRYGADNTASKTEPRRDEIEFHLLDTALAEGLPVLGICRGFQLINVHLGGSLHQDVPPHARHDQDPAGSIHAVEFAAGSGLHGLFGPSLDVNSLHHQAVDRLGAGLSATGVADDGTIEGIEHESGNLLAVQWHPEMMESGRPVFDWLIERTR